MPTLHRILLGITHVYLLEGVHGYLLIDAGSRAMGPAFGRALQRRGVRPDQIRLIVITHVHFDHVGSLRAIHAGCGCPVLVHRAEAGLLSTGRVVLPPGTRPLTRLLTRLARRRPRFIQRVFHFDPVVPTHVPAGPLDLAPFGFDARVVPTPGHTAGSLSVVTPSGRAFVGDLAVNYRPGGRGPFLPPFGDSLSQVRRSWRALMAMGVSTFYPAHGCPFDPHSVLEAGLPAKP